MQDRAPDSEVFDLEPVTTHPYAPINNEIEIEGDLEENNVDHHAENNQENQQADTRAEQISAFAKKYALPAFNTTLAALGSVGPVLTYMPTGAVCVAAKKCGAWVLFFLPPKVAEDLFVVCGSASFAAGSCFMSGASIPKILEYIGSQSTIGGKIAKIVLVMTVAAPMLVQTLLTNLGSRTATTPGWQLPLAVVSALPGALFSASHILGDIIPVGYYQIISFLNKPYQSVKPWFGYGTTVADLNEAAFQQVKDAITIEGRARLRAIMSADAKTFDNGLQDAHLALSELLKSSDENVDFPNLFENGMHYFGVFAGLVISIGPSYPLFMNSLGFISEHITDQSLAIMATIIASYSMIFNNAKLCVDVTEKTCGVIAECVSGKEVHSPAFRSYPLMTGVAVILSVILASFSYSLVYEMADRNLPHNNLNLYAPILGMAIYHFGSYILLFLQFLQMFTPSPKAKILFGTEAVLDEIEKMPGHHFQAYVDQLPATKQKFKDHVSDAVQNVLAEQTRDVSPAPLSALAESARVQSQPESRSRSWFASCCAFLGPKQRTGETQGLLTRTVETHSSAEERAGFQL